MLKQRKDEFMDYGDRKLMKRHVQRIKEVAKEIGRDVTIMEICGGHTNVIMQYGIQELLPANLRLISGPGCPVCVSSQRDIDSMIALADEGIPVATYGDMLKVPGSRHSLDDARAMGGRIFEVYSAAEVMEIRKKHSDVVFFGVGFETTAPMTTYLLKNGVCVYSVHKLVPPALKVLIDGEVRIDGFIDPGHVSTIIGADAYGGIEIPQVISGFTPERVLRALSILVELIRDKRSIVVNGYPEAVKKEGNRVAQKLLREHFYVADSEWRGLGTLPLSGLEVREGELNAKMKYTDLLAKVPAPKKTGCRCGEILKGLIDSSACPLYGKACTPENPQGPCMVSSEGTCAIAYRYGKGA
ncbi:MAG: hydrogenase formation protein HypD [Candidatus Micrarchaeota archaeon]